MVPRPGAFSDSSTDGSSSGDSSVGEEDASYWNGVKQAQQKSSPIIDLAKKKKPLSATTSNTATPAATAAATTPKAAAATTVAPVAAANNKVGTTAATTAKAVAPVSRRKSLDSDSDDDSDDDSDSSADRRKKKLATPPSKPPLPTTTPPTTATSTPSTAAAASAVATPKTAAVAPPPPAQKKSSLDSDSSDDDSSSSDDDWRKKKQKQAAAAAANPAPTAITTNTTAPPVPTATPSSTIPESSSPTTTTTTTPAPTPASSQQAKPSAAPRRRWDEDSSDEDDSSSDDEGKKSKSKQPPPSQPQSKPLESPPASPEPAAKGDDNEVPPEEEKITLTTDSPFTPVKATQNETETNDDNVTMSSSSPMASEPPTATPAPEVNVSDFVFHPAAIDELEDDDDGDEEEADFEDEDLRLIGSHLEEIPADPQFQQPPDEQEQPDKKLAPLDGEEGEKPATPTSDNHHNKSKKGSKKKHHHHHNTKDKSFAAAAAATTAAAKNNKEASDTTTSTSARRGTKKSSSSGGGGGSSQRHGGGSSSSKKHRSSKGKKTASPAEDEENEDENIIQEPQVEVDEIGSPTTSSKSKVNSRDQFRKLAKSTSRSTEGEDEHGSEHSSKKSSSSSKKKKSASSEKNHDGDDGFPVPTAAEGEGETDDEFDLTNNNKQSGDDDDGNNLAEGNPKSSTKKKRRDSKKSSSSVSTAKRRDRTKTHSGKSRSSKNNKKKMSSSSGEEDTEDAMGGEDREGKGSSSKKKSSSGKRRKSKSTVVKSEALLGLVAHVDETMQEVETILANNNKKSKKEKKKSSENTGEEEEDDCRNLLNGFETLVGILLQLSDEVELMSTCFAKAKDQAASQALNSLLDFAPILDKNFVQLAPALKHFLAHPKQIDEELGDLFYGMHLVLELLGELSQRVRERQEWSPRACTCCTTLLELFARDSVEVTSIYNDVDTPPFRVSSLLHQAWTATGHEKEYKSLSKQAQDLTVFRQISYEVILSCDQWCTNVETLMDICGIDDSMLEEGHFRPRADAAAAAAFIAAAQDEPGLALAPDVAVQVLEKIHGGPPIPRRQTLSRILRRMLPGHKITDPTLTKDSLVGLKNDKKPVVASSTMIAISSIPERNSSAPIGNNPNNMQDPDGDPYLGVAGVGKSTLAAMVATHPDVRRQFSDGIAWIYLGNRELNYARYVQCLKDILSQLDLPDVENEPLFPELLPTPGEPLSRSRRREEGFMMFVRESMADFLQDLNVLLVLDDVWLDADLDWFDFGIPEEDLQRGEPLDSGCFVLLTTRRRDLLPPHDTVEVDVLEEDEAIQLLIQESGENLTDTLMESPSKTQAVVRQCAYHPLAVKSVGRWLYLKHATASKNSNNESVEDGDVDNGGNTDEDVVSSMEKILRSGTTALCDDGDDMMYEILNMSLSPAINGEPTTIIKFCFAAFVRVFCDKEYISDFALADVSPIVPLVTAEVLFEGLLGLEEENLRKEGSLFHDKKRDAAILIPEALTSLGVIKVIETPVQPEDEEDSGGAFVEKYLQVTHGVQQEYGEYLLEEDISLKDYTVRAEKRWNRTYCETFLANGVEWDEEEPDAGLDYALEMMPVHMIRGGMYNDVVKLLSNEKFVRGRLFALGRENGARRHIHDCEILFDVLHKQRSSSSSSARKKQHDPRSVLRQAFKVLGDHLAMDEEEYIQEEGSPEAVEVARCEFEIGFALAKKRCWEAAISHWERSQDLFVSSLGMVEVVAGVLFNVGVVYSQRVNGFDQALNALKQCLRIRGAIHGEDHILYAQTIQKIGDTFWAMSDYSEAIESYNWALDVMHVEPSHHRIDIGDILENMGRIHYSKGEIEEHALQCFEDALRSKVADLGKDSPELASIYEYIGHCLVDDSRTVEDAIDHYEESIRLRELDPHGGHERDADVYQTKGILFSLQHRLLAQNQKKKKKQKGKGEQEEKEKDMQQQAIECYERALSIMVTKVPHRKEKVAALLHSIALAYLQNGEPKKAQKLLEECLQARRKIFGYVHLEVAATLYDTAILHQYRERHDKALKCLEEALKIRQLRLPDSVPVAATHEKIGSVARTIGKAKKAEMALMEALRIRKAIHGEDHIAVAQVMQELGDMFVGLGDYEEASKYFRDALKIRHDKLGAEDLAVAETFFSMGFMLMHQGALDKALECLDESYSIRKFKLGADAKECGHTLNAMGTIQLKRNELDSALQILTEALRVRKVQGDKLKIADTLENIGKVYREKQEYDVAKARIEECLKVRKQALGGALEDDGVANAYLAIGHVLSDREKLQGAMESYQQALAIRSRLHGDGDESVAAVLQAMGMVEFKAKRLDRAMKLLKEFISIRESNETEPDGDYVNALFTIGNIHKLRGNESAAQSSWANAYSIFRESGLAESNPEVAAAMERQLRGLGGSGSFAESMPVATRSSQHTNRPVNRAPPGASGGGFGPSTQQQRFEDDDDDDDFDQQQRKKGVFGRLKKPSNGNSTSNTIKGSGGLSAFGKRNTNKGQRL